MSCRNHSVGISRPRPARLRLLVDLAGDRVELGALQVAAFRIGDLVLRGAAVCLAVDDVGERDAAVGQRVAVLAALAAAVAMLGLLRARLVAEVLGVGGRARDGRPGAGVSPKRR